MKLRFSCPHCGVPNAYEEFEAGMEKYCISCQRQLVLPSEAGDAPSARELEKPPTSVAVPTALEPAAAKPTVRVTSTPAPAQPPPANKPKPPPARTVSPEASPKKTNARVFGVIDTESLVQGKVFCPCDSAKPVEIPFRVSDIAVGFVYCPRCSRAVSVAQGLEKVQDLSPGSSQVNVGVTPERVRSRPPYLLRALAGFLVATVLVGSVLWAWRDTPAVSAVLDQVGISDLPWLGASVRAKPLEAKVIPLTVEQIYRIAILQASAPSGVLHALPALHPGLFVKGKAVEENPITLANIEALKKQTNASEALITAEVWKQMLIDSRFPSNDPRFAALEGAIQFLQNRLAPPQIAASPTTVAKFRDLLGTLRTAISEKNLAQGSAAVAEADGLLEKHPRDLAPFSQSYFVLKRRYTEIEREINGVVRVEKLLDASVKALRADNSTEAMENLAKAKFLAARTPMNKETGDRLDQRVRDLTPDLLFARGKRSIMDLRQCLTEGDMATRDLLVADANIHLPGLLESKIRDLTKELNRASKASIGQASGSEFGKKVAFRLAYERALEAFGAEDALGLFENAAKATQLTPSDAPKVEGLVFEFLDQVGGDALLLGEEAPDFAEKVTKLKNVLQQAEVWKNSPRWIKLDTTLGQRGERYTKSALAKAKALAAKDQFQEARNTLKAALALAEPAAIKQVKELDQRWEQELKVRADQEAQEKQWKRISELRQAEKLLEAWVELGQFSQRYPKSPHLKEVAVIDESIRKAVKPALASKFQELEQFHDKKKWTDFHGTYQLLSKLPLASVEKTKLDQYRRKVEESQQQARGKFFQLSTRHRSMITQDQVRIMLEELPAIVAAVPDLAEAESLLGEAREKGHQYAEKLLPTVANLAAASPRLAAERVRLIEILDSNGPLADEARKMLKKR